MAFVIADDMQFFQPIGGTSGHGNRPGLGGGGAAAMWSYKTEDAITAVDAVDYFLVVADLLGIGDLIYVTVVTNRGAATEDLADAGFLVVVDNDGDTITTSTETAITITSAT